MQDEIDAYLEQLSETQERADAAAARYWEADLALYELSVEIANLSARTEVIDAEVAELRRRMIEIAVQRYIDSTTPPSILAGDDINRQAVVDALARFVSEGSLDIIDDYRRARDDLEQAQAELAERARHQQELIAQAAVAAAEVQAELSAIGDVYLVIAPRLYEQDRLLDELEETERRRLAEELRRRPGRGGAAPGGRARCGGRSAGGSPGCWGGGRPGCGGPGRSGGAGVRRATARHAR